MNKKILKITTFVISFILIADMFFYCSITAYAFPSRLKDGTWVDKPWSEAAEEIWLTIQYGLCQMGVFFVNGADFKQWLKNTKDYQDLWDENGRLAKNVSIDTETGNVTYTKEIMTVLKSAADEYIKTEQTKEENGGFYLLPTFSSNDLKVDWFGSKTIYDRCKGLLNKYGLLILQPKYGEYGVKTLVAAPFIEGKLYSCEDLVFIDALDENYNLEEYSKNNDSPVLVRFYDNVGFKYINIDLQYVNDVSTYVNNYDLTDATAYPYFQNMATATVCINNNLSNTENTNRFLCSSDGCMVRVFVSDLAAKNYSVGKRKVYLTENYYNYVPEDLKVSVDDLQKTVDDLKDVIDDLLSKIKDDTNEQEIMDLLKQILDALRDQQGTGGGGSGGGGGGDVTVDIDLTQTNSWLSKIYQMLKNISDKLAHFRDDFSFFVEDFKNMFPDVGTGESTSWLQEQLDEIIKLLKSIKRWTAVDTVIDGVDALADWLDLIKDVIKDAKEGAGSAVAAIAGTVGDSVDMMSQKFPFSVPWDILFFISVMSAEPQVPHFEIPFNIELSALDITIDYTMELDFEQLQWLSDLSRLLLSMTYAVGLLKMTAGITSVGKEE